MRIFFEADSFIVCIDGCRLVLNFSAVVQHFVAGGISLKNSDVYRATIWLDVVVLLKIGYCPEIGCETNSPEIVQLVWLVMIGFGEVKTFALGKKLHQSVWERKVRLMQLERIHLKELLFQACPVLFKSRLLYHTSRVKPFPHWFSMPSSNSSLISLFS